MAPFSYLINKHGDDLAILWIDSHPDMGTGETAYPGFHAIVVSALTARLVLWNTAWHVCHTEPHTEFR